jgi:hypothetical protein
MSEPAMTCAALQELAAELAMGTVSGAERAAALDHLAACRPCRELVDQLARAADSLLLLAPEIEPPPGFESKVLSRLGVATAPRRHPARHRRVLVGVAAAVLVAALSVVGVAQLDGDRTQERASALRTALTVDDEGRWTCRALVYGDGPTWLVVSLDRTDDLSATFSVEAFRFDDPTPVPVGTFALENGHGTFARPVGLRADDVRSVRVLDAGGRVRYTMTFEST